MAKRTARLRRLGGDRATTEGFRRFLHNEARDDAKIAAALRWLEGASDLAHHSRQRGRRKSARGGLSAGLKGGHVVVTARASNFPASLRKLEVGALDESAATEFLLERTREDREPANDDPARAREIARELGGLALGLEQAAAYIATERIGFTRYLALWREKSSRAGRRRGPGLP